MPAKGASAPCRNTGREHPGRVEQGLVDIMLMSAHTNDLLTIQERLFDESHDHTRGPGRTTPRISTLPAAAPMHRILRSRFDPRQSITSSAAKSTASLKIA
jgi:hypothetical protein